MKLKINLGESKMKKLKKFVANLLILLTISNTSAFALNKKLHFVAGVVGTAAILTAGIYAFKMNDMVESQAIDILNQPSLAKEDIDKCEKTEQLIKNNKVLFTKKGTKSIEKILDDKTIELKKSNKLIHNQIMKKISDLYDMQLQYKIKGDMENYKICKKNINSLFQLGFELAN